MALPSRRVAFALKDGQARIFGETRVGCGERAGIKLRAAVRFDLPAVLANQAESNSVLLGVSFFGCVRHRGRVNSIPHAARAAGAQNDYLSEGPYCTVVVQVLLSNGLPREMSNRVVRFWQR
jgi:hypothetical protein